MSKLRRMIILVCLAPLSLAFSARATTPSDPLPKRGQPVVKALKAAKRIETLKR